MLNFDLLGGGGAKYLLPCCCIYDHILKKLNFDPLTPPQGSGEVVGVCEQNVCYHFAAFVMIPFNLICNMAML